MNVESVYVRGQLQFRAAFYLFTHFIYLAEYRGGEWAGSAMEERKLFLCGHLYFDTFHLFTYHSQ